MLDHALTPEESHSYISSASSQPEKKQFDFLATFLAIVNDVQSPSEKSF